MCFVYAFDRSSSTIKNNSTTINNKRKKEKKMQWRQKGCFLLQVPISIYNCKCKGLQGGTLCGPVFCNFFKRVWKENSCFVEGEIFEFLKVCFIYVFDRSSSTIKNISTTIKNKRKKEKRCNGCRKVVFNCKCPFQFIIASARACKGVPFVDLFFAIF